MRECKILEILTAAESNKLTSNFKDGIAMYDFPAAEQQVNKYLAEGYRVVNMCSLSGAILFYLEREV